MLDTSYSGPDPVLRVAAFAATASIVDEFGKASEYLSAALVSHDLMFVRRRAVAMLLSRTGNA